MVYRKHGFKESVYINIYYYSPPTEADTILKINDTRIGCNKYLFEV